MMTGRYGTDGTARQKRSFGARLLCGWLRLHGMLPLRVHWFWAKILAFLVEKVFRYRRDVVIDNLSGSFPDKSPEEIRDISHRFYLHFAKVLTEAVWFGGRRGEKGRQRLRRSHLVEFANPEDFNRLLARKGQVMMMFAHTGNWELTLGFLNYSYGEPLQLASSGFGMVYRRLSDPLSDQVIGYNRMAMLEDLAFDGLVESFDVKAYVDAHREPGRAFLLITDQHPYAGRRGIDVSFMHRQTTSMSAAASLAVKYDMAAVYMRFECRPDGGYRITLVPLSEHAGGEDPRDLMQRYYNLLEKDLEAQPWNYLWTHRRWKA